MNPRERWGLPDWMLAEEYPGALTDQQWRWEFLRRRPDFRRAWEEEPGDVDPLLAFGEEVIYDPRQRGLACTISVTETTPEEQHVRRTVFQEPGRRHIGTAELCLRLGASLAKSPEKLEREAARLRYLSEYERNAGFYDYRINIAKPLGPQVEAARSYLLLKQEELYGKKSTPRPSRELWPLYLRVLDARDCGASWPKIGKALWPSHKGDLKAKACRTHEQAAWVRDNFPI